MMDSEEDRIRKQGQTDAAKKTGQIAARGVADYYTGGKYEQIRNAPVVGKVAQGAENTVGKVVGAADKLSGRKLGKVSKKLDDAGVLDTANDAIGTFGSINGGGKNPQDVDALKNRAGVNKGVGRPSEFDEPGLSNSKDGLKEKEDEGALKDQAKEQDRIEKEKRQSERNLIQKGIEDKAGITEIRNKIKRTVLFTRIGLAVAAVIGIVIVFATIIVYLDSVADAVTNFFGVSEADLEDEEGNISTGFFTDDEYLFDENGNELSEEEAIGKLYANGEECKITIWTKIKDFFNFSKRFSDKCAFMRYVRTEAESSGVDTALIISSIMNGYGTQADQGDYIDNDYVPDDYVSSNEQYKSLEKILENKDFNINKDTIDDIVKYSVTKKTFFYYEFIEKNKVTHEGECKKKIWYEYEYNLEKWKVFMRFGKTAATEFDRANYTFYLQERNDEECKNIQEPETYSDTFYQYADVDSKTKDVFTPYNGPYASVTFDYKNGYAYNQFPGFLTSINNSGTTIEYDDIFTPKFVEQVVQDTIYQKVRINEILMKEDMDSTDQFALVDGSGSVSGGFCSDYLSSDPANTRVSLTDCHGNYLTTVSFEDYIIGVANAEVSNSNDNYVLSEMLAAISYAFHRRNNYARGSTITMKSGTCDQAYCSMKNGCHTVAAPDVCTYCTSFLLGGSKGRNPGLYAKYQSLYQTAVKYLVVSNGRVHNAHYVSTIQNEWKRKAMAGMYFTDIIAETYASEGAEVIECTDYGQTLTEEDTSEKKVGNTTDSTYTKSAPDLGKYYGFSYSENANNSSISINPKWKNENLTTISPSCSNASFASQKYTVNKKATENYKKAFNGICKLLTTGVKIKNGSTCRYTMDHLKGGTTFTESKTQYGNLDLHSYGLSQSWNYASSFNINGVNYIPYSPTSGSENYYKFVNAIGGEENCQNINYILWKYAYKDAGFRWGGNNGGDAFNASLFEIKY